MTKVEKSLSSENRYTRASVRKDLIRQEDIIIYGLIERAKFPSNSHIYDEKYAQIPGFSGSLVEFVVKNTEDIQAKAGRYTNPKENPFFPKNLHPSSVPSYPFSQVMMATIHKLRLVIFHYCSLSQEGFIMESLLQK